jgi:hypothetical protein
MNERIKELIKQHGVDITIDGMGYGEGNIEGLAELIVRECIQVVDDTMTENQEINIGLVMASAKIVAHFGVEE